MFNNNILKKFKKMTLKFKIINYFIFVPMTIVFANSHMPLVKGNEESNVLSMASDNYFVYPHDIIDYSVSGSSLIEFNLNSKGEVENLQIIESLGIPFDKSIIDGLSHYVSKKIISARNNFNNQYRLKIKFEN